MPQSSHAEVKAAEPRGADHRTGSVVLGRGNSRGSSVRGQGVSSGPVDPGEHEGADDYAASLAAYQALRDQKLAALPGVQRLTSTIVMKRVVADRPYPT